MLLCSPESESDSTATITERFTSAVEHGETPIEYQHNRNSDSLLAHN